jgi:hypothetical protein
MVMFCGRVRREVRSRHFTYDGSDVDQDSTSLLAELPHSEIAAVERAEQVGLDDLNVVF